MSYQDIYGEMNGGGVSAEGQPYQGPDGRWYDANGQLLPGQDAPSVAPSGAPGGVMLTNPTVSGTAPRPPGWVGAWPPPQVGGPPGDYTGVGAGWTSAPGDPYSQTWKGPGPNPNWVVGSPEQKADTTSPPPPDVTKGALAPFTEPAPNFPQEPAFSFDAFKAPSFEDALNDPGYQFGVQQGEAALGNWAAARGTLNDSDTGKMFIDYGRNAAQQGYGNVYAREFGTWQGNEQAAERRYGMNRQTRFIDPWTAAYNAWAQRGNFYLNNQGTVANAALNFGNMG